MTAAEIHLESHLLEPVRGYLYRRGVREIRSEVKFYDYRLDIFGYSDKNESTYAVELKLKKWRRALEQALIYQLCADFVYIALPSTSVKLVDLPTLKMYGVGLISVYPTLRCRKVLEAVQSVSVRKGYKDLYIDLLQGEQNA